MKTLIIIDSKFLKIVKILQDITPPVTIQVDLMKGNYFLIVYDKEKKTHGIKNFTVYRDETFTITVKE